MPMTYGSCGLCKFCHQFKGTDDDGRGVIAYYCRRRSPVASPTEVVASSSVTVLMKGVWPAVDPNADGCAEFVESEFA